MRLIIYLFCLVLALGTGCEKPNRLQKSALAAQVMSYEAGNDQFTILALENNGVTRADAKQASRKKAAQVTIDNGYRYFSIVSESEVKVVKSSESAEFPGNLYQELIIEHDFGREKLERDQGSSPQMYPAIRLIIKCYAEKPAFKETFDAQALSE